MHSLHDGHQNEIYRSRRKSTSTARVIPSTDGREDDEGQGFIARAVRMRAVYVALQVQTDDEATSDECN